MRWPLRYQILWPMAAVMLLAVVGVGGVGAVLATRATKARIAAQIAGVVDILEHSNFPLTDAVLTQLRALSGAELILVGRDGKVAGTGGLSPAAIDRLLAAETSGGQSFELGGRPWIRSQGYFHAVVQLPRRGEAEPTTLHICYPEDDYRRALQRAVYPPLAAIALALPVVVGLAAFTASRISGRVGRLQRQVEAIARGNFQQMPLPDRDDEVRALGEAVNRMAEMLGQYEDQVRATERMRTLALLGSGIAHQLRNSTTGCQIALDLHAEHCPAVGDRESLQVAKRQLRLMEQYLQRFLQLGRRPDRPSRQTVDLAAVIDEAIPLVQPAARHARLDLEWQCAERPCPVNGDSAMLTQMVVNLLVNAIEAASQAGTASNDPGAVKVELARNEADWLRLAVCDTGPGPSVAVRDRLFEPFVTGRPDGVGIGLALAREVAEFHGGSIHFERADGLTRFVVELQAVSRRSNLTGR